jgi:hypothetical protein
MAAIIKIEITYGEPELSVWCETCLLPSAVRFPLMIMNERGLTLIGAIEYCRDCGGKRSLRYSDYLKVREQQ